MSKPDKVQYIKVYREGRRHFDVNCCYHDREENDGSYKTSVKAERRARVLSRLYNCEWGTNYP